MKFHDACPYKYKSCEHRHAAPLSVYPIAENGSEVARGQAYRNTGTGRVRSVRTTRWLALITLLQSSTFHLVNLEKLIKQKKKKN